MNVPNAECPLMPIHVPLKRKRYIIYMYIYNKTSISESCPKIHRIPAKSWKHIISFIVRSQVPNIWFHHVLSPTVPWWGCTPRLSFLDLRAVWNPLAPQIGRPKQPHGPCWTWGDWSAWILPISMCCPPVTAWFIKNITLMKYIECYRYMYNKSCHKCP